VRPLDLDSFQKLMVEVQEVYGHRPPSPAVLQHWVDALKDDAFHTVDSVLRNWIRTKPKPPMIADITKICADLLSDRVENRAEADRKAFAAPIVFKGVTPHGRKCIAQMRALIAKPKRPSKDWARKIMENPKANELQREFAKGVYVAREREPGDDDDLPMPALYEETVEM
jgi:hypothetical protein